MLRLTALALSLSAALVAPAASAVTLTFAGIPPFAAISSYYNGGFATDVLDPGVNVAGPGPDYGITFLFANTPPVGTGLPDLEVIQHTASINIRMNVEGGFNGSLELDYNSEGGGNTIQVFDGANQTGTIIATFITSDTAGSFAHASIPFAGTALSVRFLQNGVGVLYDNIQVVPEPATAGLLLLGLAALGARRRAS